MTSSKLEMSGLESKLQALPFFASDVLPGCHKCITSVLSEDILLEIFEFAVFNNIKNNSPLLLGRICKAWRNLAWGHPPLWRYIYIKLSNIKGPETQFQREMIKGWLEKSGNQPLEITLFGGKIQLADSDMHLQRYAYKDIIRGWEPSAEISEHLLLTANRWRYFTANGGPLENIRLKLEAMHCRLPLLEWVFFEDSLEDSKCWNFSHHDAPSFRGFWQTGYANALAYSVPWRQCRNIFGNFRAKGCLSVLQDASSLLDDAVVTLMENWVPNPAQEAQVEKPPILLPKMTKLVLRLGEYARVNVVSGFFDCFDTPALKTLELSLRNLRQDDHFWSHFVPFVQRSGPSQLTHLTLRSPPFYDDDGAGAVALANILRLTPLLEYLSVESYTQDMFHDPLALIVLHNPEYLPCLERLSYRGKLTPLQPAKTIRALTARLTRDFNRIVFHPVSSGPESSGESETQLQRFQLKLPPPKATSTVAKMKELTIHCTASGFSNNHVLDTEMIPLRGISKALEKLGASQGVQARLTWKHPVSREIALTPRRMRWIMR